jgi:hypothetical protein
MAHSLHIRVLVLLAVGAAAVSLAAATAAAAHGTTSTAATATSVCDTGHVFFAKTKFVFHAGLAFGVFHRYIYKPLRAGAFKSGRPGRLKAALKAGAAALFVVHELKLACKDANNSSVLRPLLAPLNLAVGEFDKLTTALKNGTFATSDIMAAEKTVSSLGSKASGLGLPIADLTTGFTGG